MPDVETMPEKTMPERETRTAMESRPGSDDGATRGKDDGAA